MKKSMLYLFVIGMGLAANCHASETIKVAFGNALPPWVIPTNNEGIIIDMLKETFKGTGYSIKPIYYPYARRIISYKQGKAGAVCDMNAKIVKGNGLKGYLTQIAYFYENIGVSLKKNGFKFEKISDLTGHSVVSWQGAKTAIGGEYEKMANANKKYSEVANQEKQIKLVFLNRADLIQLDRQIFKYYRNKMSKDGRFNTKEPVDIFPLFGKNECGFLFRDGKAGKTFDGNFAKLKESGRYKELFEKYTK